MKSYHIRCPKCNNDHSFYRYGKDSNGYQKYLCRNCHHQFAPELSRSEGQIVSGNIRLAPCAERLPFCITIMSITPTAAALTKSATIPFLYGSPPPLPLRLCQPFSASTISSVCVIPFKCSLRLCQCFFSARIPFGDCKWEKYRMH